ncbi:MAG: rubredoxin-like domain-containing protein [Candidatus Bipolaricaulota bacterium]
MPTWLCTGCGEEIRGGSRPKVCPHCGAPKDKIERSE